MIIGKVKVVDGAVETHRDSYLLPNLSVVSVRRPFLGAGMMLGGAFSGYAAVFADLLHAHEIVTIAGMSVMTIFASSQMGQLKLLSRDLRGSELGGVIYGQYSRLNQIRSEIVAAMRGGTRGNPS